MDSEELTNWIESNAEVTHSRSSGPGGQNVNKVNTRVTLHIVLNDLPLPEPEVSRVRTALAGRINLEDQLVVISGETRSQLRNKENAVLRAVSLIEGAIIKPKKRRRTKPTKASIEKRLTDKKRRAEKKKNRKPDYL